ncbi:MAG TPA: hypothetical protein VNQ77_14805 [Frankiaceae bacterium]|nr:hypothetical protein [Frankiaceae bacterium]
MRTRLLALPFLAATTLAVLGASPAAPIATSTTNPCLPHEIPVRGRGLDGGVGCHDPRKQEGPADMLRARAVFEGPRAEVSGAERLAALRQAQSMKMAAQRLREKTGAADFATKSGTLLQGTGRAWVALGPSPLIVDDPKYPGGQGYGNDKVQGRVAALLADPADPTGNTIYMGSANGGVWKSTNAGEKWTSIGDSLPSQSTGALAMADNGWLFVGLGEGNTGSNNYAGAGVVRTKDGGKTWSALLPGIPDGIVTTHIAVAGNTVLVGTQWGLFRSDDLGDSFSRATLPTGGTGESDKAFGNFVTDVRFQPGSEDNALAAVGWRSGGIGTAAGLYRTTDGGASWTKVNATGFGTASTSTDPIGRVTLAYDERDGQENVVWALIQDAGKLNNEPFPVDIAVGAEANTTNLNGIYRSADNGATWVVQANNQTLMGAAGSGISTTNVPLNGNYGPGVQAWYNQYVAVDPSAPAGTERVVVGLEEVYQGTLDENVVVAPFQTRWQTIGRYWNACIQAVLVQLNCEELGLPQYQGYTTHADQHAATWAKTADGWMLYVGNDGGVYRQPSAADGYDNGAWTSLNAGGVNTTQPYAAAMGKDGTVYLGLQDNGTAKISPDGTANEVIGGDGFDVAVDPTDSDLAWEEYANGILRITRDGGVSWSGDVSPTAATGQRFSTPFELDPTDAEHFLYAGNQVFEHESASAMSASSWVQVFDVRNDEVSPDAAVTALDVHGTAAYAAWCGRPPTPPAGSSSCNTTTGDGNFEPNLFRRGIVTNVADGCKRAKASEECWRHVAAKGLPNRMVQGVEIDPVDPMTVYVAMASYSRHWAYDPDTLVPGVVFRSTDGGKNFTDVSGDLPQTFGSDVLVHGDLLIAATDVGVFATSAKDPGDWVPMGTGIPDAVPAIEISTNPQGTKLVLATHGRGVWVMPLTPVARNTDDDDDKGTDGGGGPIATTGLPAWVLLGATVPAVGAVLLRRRLRAVRE